MSISPPLAISGASSKVESARNTISFGTGMVVIPPLEKWSTRMEVGAGFPLSLTGRI
jgi:hypothetical protein